MHTEIRLDRLPPDIIRRIVHAGPDSATDMRLLSRSWNSLAKEYLAEHTKLPSSIERVFFSRGIREDMYNGRTHRSRPWLEAGCMYMYTILPRKHLRRVGHANLGGWLSEHKMHSGDFVEVKPKGMPQRIDKTFYRQMRNVLAAVNILLAWGLHWATSLVPSIAYIEMYIEFGLVTPSFVLSTVKSCIPALLLTGLLACGISTMLKMIIRRANDKQFDRFGRLFSMFTHIETLVLDNFRMSSGCTKSIEAIDEVLNTIKGVQVNRLEVRENYLNKRLLKQILELCLSHKVRYVHITVQDADMDEFQKFVSDLSAADVTLDLYERNGMNCDRYFDCSRQFFTDTATHLRLRQISMRMTTIHDPSFDKVAYKYGVKSHIRCEKLVGNILNQPLNPVPEHRGFNHRWD